MSLSVSFSRDGSESELKLVDAVLGRVVIVQAVHVTIGSTSASVEPFALEVRDPKTGVGTASTGRYWVGRATPTSLAFVLDGWFEGLDDEELWIVFPNGGSTPFGGAVIYDHRSTFSREQEITVATEVLTPLGKSIDPPPPPVDVPSEDQQLPPPEA